MVSKHNQKRSSVESQQDKDRRTYFYTAHGEMAAFKLPTMPVAEDDTFWSSHSGVPIPNAPAAPASEPPVEGVSEEVFDTEMFIVGLLFFFGGLVGACFAYSAYTFWSGFLCNLAASALGLGAWIVWSSERTGKRRRDAG